MNWREKGRYRLGIARPLRNSGKLQADCDGKLNMTNEITIFGTSAAFCFGSSLLCCPPFYISLPKVPVAQYMTSSRVGKVL